MHVTCITTIFSDNFLFVVTVTNICSYFVEIFLVSLTIIKVNFNVEAGKDITTTLVNFHVEIIIITKPTTCKEFIVPIFQLIMFTISLEIFTKITLTLAKGLNT